ncbi:MAG: NUDIX hydrolase [Clostridiales bacterium]|nr:NUDIX hydrolase [Clostridiales bacterium]
MDTVDFGKTNWSQSVGGVCIKDGKVLLARHTYGAGKGMLIIPGGYVDFGETPEETLVREFQEETGVTVKAGKLFGMRFSAKDWYAVFEAQYVEGEARSDGDENDKVIWMNVEEALANETVPDLTKKMICCAVTGEGFELIPYDSKTPGRNLYAFLKD